MARTVYKLIFKMNQRFIKQAFILIISTLALYEVNNAHLNKKKRPKKLKRFVYKNLAAVNHSLCKP